MERGLQGQFARVYPTSDFELTEYRVCQLPGPGRYQAVLAHQGKLATRQGLTTTFAAGKSKE